MIRNEIMNFKFGKSIQIAVLIAFAFSCAARAQTACEARVASVQAAYSKSDFKVTAAGVVISFTAPPGTSLDSVIRIFGGDEEAHHTHKGWGCTQMLFISAETGEIVKRIDLGSADSKVLTACEENAADMQATFSQVDKDLAPGKITAAGTVISFTEAPGSGQNASIKVWGNAENSAKVKSWGCTEMQFISAETGEIVKRIDLGPAESKVAAHEKESSKPADSPVEQLEEPTAENLNRLLDLAIGFHRRELSVLKHLQTWYEVDPNHPDAVALKEEFCANLNTDPTDHFVAVFGVSPKDAVRNKKAWEAIEKSGPDATAEFMEKDNRNDGLIDKVVSAFHELKGMGFSCGQ